MSSSGQPGPAGWTDALSTWLVDADVADIPGDGEPGHDAQWMQPPPADGAVEFRVVIAPPAPVIVDLSAAVEKSMAFASQEATLCLLFAQPPC